MLWSYRTTPRSTTGESSFRMAYGFEAVTPVEISLSSPRVNAFDSENSLEGWKFYDTLKEEMRNEATLKTEMIQRKTAAYFNKRVKT